MLVVEKDATFQRLMDDGFTSKYPAILVTVSPNSFISDPYFGFRMKIYVFQGKGSARPEHSSAAATPLPITARQVLLLDGRQPLRNPDNDHLQIRLQGEKRNMSWADSSVA